jgi:hypothetical protein
MIANEKLHRWIQKDLRWQENLFVSLLQSYPVEYIDADETGFCLKFKNVSMSLTFMVDAHGPIVLGLCVNSKQEGIYCVQFTQHATDAPYTATDGFQSPSWREGPLGDALNGDTAKWLDRDVQQAYFGCTCTLDEEIAREIDPKIEKGPHNYFQQDNDDDDENDLWPEDYD